MIIATEKLIPGVLPPKEETEGVDFLAILHSFDPSLCSEEAYETFAERNPSIVPFYQEEYFQMAGDRLMPEERLHLAEVMAAADERALVAAVRKGDYDKCRKALVKAIGTKVCLYLVQETEA
jgi:hypothetical protein